MVGTSGLRGSAKLTIMLRPVTDTVREISSIGKRSADDEIRTVYVPWWLVYRYR
jgi:hypothetical protein